MLIVTTKKELREARKNKTKSFVIRGELAKELLAAEQKRSNKKNADNMKNYIGDFKVENVNRQQGAAVVATTTVALVLGIMAISSITVIVLYALKKDYNVKVRVKAKVKPTKGKGDVEVEPEVELECERR